MVEQYLGRYGVDHLHYMVPLENVPLILALGILSYNGARELPHEDVALRAVQRRRESPIPGTTKCIHDYVPLYFATHTPMQYVITQGARGRNPVIDQEDLIFIEVDAVKIFQCTGVIFTDGNAAASETRFFVDPADLNQLDWSIINTPNCFSREYRRKKAAEVLVPNQVPVEHFERIVTSSREASNRLARAVKALYDELRTKRPDFDWAYVKKHVYSVDLTHYY